MEPTPHSAPAATPRSGGTILRPREPLHWPAGRPFRILSIDGGGICGILPATIIQGLEDRYLAGSSIGRYFDLVAGTSTGGIIALGIGCGLPGRAIADLYVNRGNEIFPPLYSFAPKIHARLRMMRRMAVYLYERTPLERLLRETFGDRVLGTSSVRLCIPAFEGRFGEVQIFKTRHHQDYERDWQTPMVNVALSTAAAPTYFPPFANNGYVFVDGGIWANNPVMIALIDALACFGLQRRQVHILSLGCGGSEFVVHRRLMFPGGLFNWRNVMYAAMRLQSQNALGQAGLLIGRDQLIRLEGPVIKPSIELDDWTRSKDELPNVGRSIVNELGEQIAMSFFQSTAEPFVPIPM